MADTTRRIGGEALKTTYIYRVDAGYSHKDEYIFREFFYARNKKTLIKYVQNIWKEYHFNKFSVVKIGLSNIEEEMRMISDFESWQLKQHYMADAYAERIEP